MKFFHLYAVALVMMISSLICGHFVNIHTDNVSLLKTLDMRFCYISFVKIDGKTYIVKQKKPFNKLLGVVRDAVTASVAESFNIAHQVAVIPYDKEFPGKIRTDWPATIHTIAPGKMIKEYKNSIFKGMNIKQAEVGFRPDMLLWMSKHPQLIKIVALDTFLCNHDRHRGNLFYNEKTDSFCAIDMDSSFKYNLPELACNNLLSMKDADVRSLKKSEINALIKYKKALLFLLKKYTPEKIVALYDDYAQQAGFIEGNEIYTQKFHLELERNKEIIVQSYDDVKRLVAIVESVIKRATQSKR